MQIRKLIQFMRKAKLWDLKTRSCKVYKETSKKGFIASLSFLNQDVKN